MNLSLPIHLSIHIAFGLLAGLIVWRIWKKPWQAFFFALAGGFLVDFDHFIDYYFAFGFAWNWDYFRNGYPFLKSGRILVLLHAWEYATILVLLVFLVKSKIAKTILLSLALGLCFHLATDVVVDEMPVKSYSIVYRISHNFEIKYLINPSNYEKHLQRKARVKF
ncbi:MAG TPA: hypothetical protein DCS28_00995 [Candidatus Moranbacteria bacterium]|nr:hypothetical protein [Candidatus Moranbacteria bacterium]HAT74605.1 hypothetical protein [Candidatus Moranbacteria bacterium]